MTEVTKDGYLNYVKKAREIVAERYENQLRDWQSKPEGEKGEKPRITGIEGVLDAGLYKATGDIEYARSARKILLENPWVNRYPFVRAIRQIQPSGLVSEADIKAFQDILIKNLEGWSWNRIVEWGAMNHSTNYLVDGLTAVANFCPNHPDAPYWKQMAEKLLETSWGRWSIEDSENYMPIWLRPMMNYADETRRSREFFALTTTKYYFEYFLNLISPGGGLVDFGDADFPGNWSIYVYLLERGATEYRDGGMKWGAHFIFDANKEIKANSPTQEIEAHSFQILEAYLGADDSVEESMPTSGSRQVLEDAVGKKVVFRSNWDRNALYLMLNYQGREDYGLDGRNHLWSTINVEAEKNHHGHADENAICQLMSEGTILLHESGYRETSTTGAHGEYRADVFHNRVVARKGRIDLSSRLLPQIMDLGRHRHVRTKLMFFHSMKEVDVSRSRVVDEDLGYQWDRVVNYLKRKKLFVLFDIVKTLRLGSYSFTNLFWTRQIENNGENWFDTWIDKFHDLLQWGDGWWLSPEPPHRSNLLIYLCENEGRKIGVEQGRKSYQSELCIYNCSSDSFDKDAYIVFSTVLIPHALDEKAEDLAKRISKVTPLDGKGVAVKLDSPNSTILVGSKLDLKLGWLKDRTRPAYTFEAGKVDYAGAVTDASMFYLHTRGEQESYAVVEATKLVHNGKELFTIPTFFRCIFEDDGQYKPAELRTPKWPAWESL